MGMMINTKLLIACLGLIISIADISTAKEWRGIVPLRSTRKDVERLIGPPSAPNGYIYKLEDVVVLIAYSKGTCKENKESVWDVPLDTVITITVSPKKKLMLDELGFNIRDFQQREDTGVGFIVHYVNEEEGVHIDYRTPDDTTISVGYTPSKEDNQLRCPNSIIQRGNHFDFYDFLGASWRPWRLI